MSDSTLPSFNYQIRISEIENDVDTLNLKEFINNDNGYRQLDRENDELVATDIHYKGLNDKRKIVNVDNLSGNNYPLELHKKEGILDSTISDIVLQNYQLLRGKYNYERLVYDKTISYMNSDILDKDTSYKSIYVEFQKVSNEVEYSILQLTKIIKANKYPVDLYIDFGSDKINSKKSISYMVFLVNQIYNNKLLDKIKSVNIPMELLKTLILSSKFYKQINYFLGIENLLIEIYSKYDVNIDEVDCYKLKSYSVKANNIYLYDKQIEFINEKTQEEGIVNVLNYLNSFSRINKLIIPTAYARLDKSYNDKVYNLSNKCSRLVEYGKDLDFNRDFIILDKNMKCYFHKDYVLEIKDSFTGERSNILFNNGINYKIIYITDNLDYNIYIRRNEIENIEFIFIRNITDLNLVV